MPIPIVDKDNVGDYVPYSVFKELHEQAKQLVKQKLESKGFTLLTPKRRDKTDFQVDIGVKRHNVDVIPKISWGEDFEISKLKIPYKPNTIFCYVNRPLTKMVVIDPTLTKDLAPKQRKPAPVQEFVEVTDIILKERKGKGINLYRLPSRAEGEGLNSPPHHPLIKKST